jgi:hypothetical protein
MKIIQMQIGQTSPEDFQVFGLGDDGMLYEWQFAWKPYAIITDKQAVYQREIRQAVYQREIRCNAGNPEGDANLNKAASDPERYTVKFFPGRSAGWVPCADAKRAPESLDHPLKST